MSYLISEDYFMHHGVKGMKWGVRHNKPSSRQQRGISKIQSKAKTQRNYTAELARRTYRKGVVDDKELYKTMSSTERQEARRLASDGAKLLNKQSHQWNKAVKEIGNTKSTKEAKAVYKKYSRMAMGSGGYVLSPSDPGDKHWKDLKLYGLYA